MIPAISWEPSVIAAADDTFAASESAQLELSIGTEIHDNATDSEWDCESQDGDDTVVEIPLSQPDLMQFSQEQQETTQQQQVATPLPSISPGFLMLTVTTIVEASTVTVQGPFAHWFEKFELPTSRTQNQMLPAHQ